MPGYLSPASFFSSRKSPAIGQTIEPTFQLAPKKGKIRMRSARDG